MAFRFRRRLRIIPGITLNLGKRGASVSVGVRGAHVTYGRRGRRATIGLPGSGLSYTAYEPYRPATAPGARRGPIGAANTALVGIAVLILVGMIAVWVAAG